MPRLGARALREDAERFALLQHAHRRANRGHVHVAAIHRKAVNLTESPAEELVFKQLFLAHEMNLSVRHAQRKRHRIEQALMVAHQDAVAILGDVLPAFDLHEEQQLDQQPI